MTVELLTVSLTIIKKCEFTSKHSIQTYFSLSRTQAGFLSKHLCFLLVNVCNSFKLTRLFTLSKLSQNDCPIPHWMTGKIIALQWTDQNKHVRFKKKEILSYLDSWLKYTKLWPKWMPKAISQRRKLTKKLGSSSRFSQLRPQDQWLLHQQLLGLIWDNSQALDVVRKICVWGRKVE